MSTAVSVDRSTLRLSEVARHVVIPEGIVDTLWFEVEARCREFGIEFDAWQDGLGQVVLGIRDDGLFAATVGGVSLSIPRQVAKTFMVMTIVVALCSLYPNLTVVWTAHRMRTATNTFQKMKALCLRPAVRPHIRAGSNQGTAIRDANGEQEIPFTNGSRIMFGAREQGFGRGFDEVDIEVFDEAQILTVRALEDMVAATNQSRFPFGALLFYMGTPPRPEDPGEVFAQRRAEALEAKKGRPDFGEPVAAGDAVYVECSADPDVGRPGGPSLDDPRQIELANPSYPHRTPPVSIKRLRKNLTGDDSWRREGLGVWDAQSGPTPPLIAPAEWGACKTENPPRKGRVAYGVKFSVDGSSVALAACRRPEGGKPHVEVVAHRSMSAGTGWLADWLEQRWSDAVEIVIDGKAGSGALVNTLRERGVPAKVLRLPKLDEVLAAHTMILEAVRTGEVTHFDQPALNDVVAHAVKRDIGKAGGWGWQSTAEGIDVSLLDAVTLALYAAMTSKRRPGRKSKVRVMA